MLSYSRCRANNLPAIQHAVFAAFYYQGNASWDNTPLTVVSFRIDDALFEVSLFDNACLIHLQLIVLFALRSLCAWRTHDR